jgi:hypothetical protein
MYVAIAIAISGGPHAHMIFCVGAAQEAMFLFSCLYSSMYRILDGDFEKPLAKYYMYNI